MAKPKTKEQAALDLEKKRAAFAMAANSDAPQVDDDEDEEPAIEVAPPEPEVQLVTEVKNEAEQVGTKKPRKKPAPKNLEFVGLKIHRDTKKALEVGAEDRGLMFSEFLRQVILDGMEAKGIKIEKLKATETPNSQ